MVPMFPRRPGCSVLENKDITEEQVKNLAKAASKCWDAIMKRNLEGFASAFKASFDAQVSMFPGMVKPAIVGNGLNDDSIDDGFLPTVQDYIDKYSKMPGVLAWKMPGAGGGGYLVLVCSSRRAFPEEAIEITIRRGGM
jgi:galactokinase/mevalonate kinase-like predicted kinase